ncbi:unnamed protein product [Calicophoron daubneyi]|uniref:Arf-GAP with dual PH domain-containing protein 1 n=1 Tax=Calicophoron daubneyi TaxID=300641 RepID=A0AAV2TPZ2_CALDB
MTEATEPVVELQVLCQKPCNRYCADCRNESVEFASVTFGTFLCSRCASAHQKIGGDVRPVLLKQIKEGIWKEETVNRLKSHGGNAKVNERLEAELPLYYRRPWQGSNCPAFLCEAFIKSKYVHEEFSKGAIERGAQSQFACSVKSGTLLKKLRDSETFCERFFELSVECNYLRYFIKPGDSEPKQTLDLEKLNITFIDPNEFGTPPHTALIQCVVDGSTRHTFVRSEDSRTIINWYNAIRLGKYHRICLSLTSMGIEFSAMEVAKKLTRDLDLAGWLSKTGPRRGDAWRKRWCVLFQRHMLYTDKPLSAFAKGELFIGSREDGFSVLPGTPENWKRYEGYAFTIITSVRPFVFVAESKQEQERWIRALEKIIAVPLTLDDSKRAALLAQAYSPF